MADNNDNDNNSASDASLIQYHPLLLDVNGDDDDTDTLHITMQPRRLLPIDATNEIIVYGGTGSSVRQIVSNNNNKDDNDGKDDDVAATGTSSTTLSSLIRHWNDDECVKAIGISSDGTNIVMANDLWEIKLYTYSNPMDCHPFCVPKTTPATVKLMDTFDAPIRDIQFYPNNNNFVAIASEGGMGILNLQDYGTQKIKYLWEQVEEYHNSGGIRSIAFHQIQSTIPKTKDVVTTTILASVSMDGRLCLWNVSDIEKPETWKLIHRETNKCIPKNDVGEIFDADPWDQSCRPVFLSIPSNNNNSGTTVLALPGMTYLQLRRINVVYDNGDNSPTITMEPFDQPNIFDSSTTTNNTVVKGHFEPIVAITTCTDNKNDSSYVVTSGRDNRIVAWSIQQRRVRTSST